MGHSTTADPSFKTRNMPTNFRSNINQGHLGRRRRRRAKKGVSVRLTIAARQLANMYRQVESAGHLSRERSVRVDNRSLRGALFFVFTTALSKTTQLTFLLPTRWSLLPLILSCVMTDASGVTECSPPSTNLCSTKKQPRSFL